jgi:hypothetical protein
MKKWTIALSMVIGLLAFSKEAFAGYWSSSIVTITMIETNDVYGRNTGASYYLTFSGAPINTGCLAGSGGQWLIASGTYPTSPNTDVGTQSIRDMLQQATSAKLAARGVKVYWNGNCSGGGTSGLPVMTGIQVY